MQGPDHRSASARHTLPQDGTLLDSSSRVLPSSVAAIRAALDRGIIVFLATGKARPAAIRAMEAVGLAGEGLVVSTSGPGVFLQGEAHMGDRLAATPGTCSKMCSSGACCQCTACNLWCAPADAS